MTHGRKNNVPELTVDPRPSGNLVVRAFVESGMTQVSSGFFFVFSFSLLESDFFTFSNIKLKDFSDKNF